MGAAWNETLRGLRRLVALAVVGPMVVGCSPDDQRGRADKSKPIVTAEDWYHDVRAFPDGIPPGARVKSLREAQWLESQPDAMGSGGSVGSTSAALSETIEGDATIAGEMWFPIGPAPVNGSSFLGNTVSGRASALAVNKANPMEIWLGAATGGVWHSDDGGMSWTPRTDDAGTPFELGGGGVGGRASLGPGSLAIGDILVEGCDGDGCQRVWVGTGEDSLRRVARTTDLSPPPVY